MITGITLGILYGLFVRIVSELRPISDHLEIISFAFLTITPFTVGAISVYFIPEKAPVPIKKQISVSSSTMLFFLLSMFLFFLEGLICIVLILPVFMVGSIAGGLVMGWVINRYSSSAKATLNSFLLLPLLLNPIEALVPKNPNIGTVASSVLVHAKPEDIFKQLTTVRKIQKDELGFSFMHLVGLPLPLEAAMNGEGVGAIRVSTWEKGVQFKERITRWDFPSSLHYEFDIAKGSIPREALDRHVELGGDYFTVLRGGYDIQLIDKHTSKLTLTTVYENRSHLKLFGRLWASWVFNDFHGAILQLMKNRAEQHTRKQTTETVTLNQ